MKRNNKRLVERSLLAAAFLVISADFYYWWFEKHEGDKRLSGIRTLDGGERLQQQGSSGNFCHPQKTTDVTPHKIVNGFLFPESVSELLADGQLFFLDFSEGIPASAEAEIEKRKLCAVESAAVHHPRNNVQLVVTPAKVKLTPTLRILVRSYPNVRLVRFRGDPFAGFGVDRRSEYADLHAAELARYTLLNTHGGVYLDLDHIVVRSLSGFNNTLGHSRFGGSLFLSPHIMIFQPKHPFLEELIIQAPNYYNAFDNETLGSRLVNGVYAAPGFDKSSITLAPQQAFDLISRQDHALPFDEDDGVKFKTKADKAKVHVVHYWYSLNNGTRIDLASSQMLALLAWSHCPKVSRKARGYL